MRQCISQNSMLLFDSFCFGDCTSSISCYLGSANRKTRILFGLQFQSSLLAPIQPIGTRLWLGLGVAKISRWPPSRPGVAGTGGVQMGSIFAVTIALAETLSQRSLDRGIDKQLISWGKRAKSRVVNVCHALRRLFCCIS